MWQNVIVPGDEAMDSIVAAILASRLPEEGAARTADPGAARAEMGTVVPFLAAVAAPSKWDAAEALSEALPEEQLELEHVHGFEGHGCNANLTWLNASEVVYRAAGLVVMHDLGTDRQRFFTVHTQRVVALAVHPVVENQVATADSSGRVLVWSGHGAETETVASSLSSYSRTTAETGASRGGASEFKVLNRLQAARPTALCFSADGTTLVVAGAGAGSSSGILSVFDLASSRRIALAETPSARVLALAAHPSGRRIVAAGEQHVRFWSMEARGLLTFKEGKFGAGRPQTQLCVAFCAAADADAHAGERRTLTGAQNGCVYVWEGTQLQQVVVAHQGPVLDVTVDAEGFVITAGADGAAPCPAHRPCCACSAARHAPCVRRRRRRAQLAPAHASCRAAFMALNWVPKYVFEEYCLKRK